jgi:predicted nucleic acid-binding protein
MPPKKIADTSFLLALYHPPDRNHSRAVRFVERDQPEVIIPQAALAEIMYMIQTRANERTFLFFWHTLATSRYFTLEPTTPGDLARALAIRRQYAAARLDFVDCCIIALAERLKITQVCTFDRRDFAIVTPEHIAPLEMLP